jgi:hypothetical protein
MGRTSGYLLRQLHTALQALLECVAEVGRQLVDKTIALPHVVSKGNIGSCDSKNKKHTTTTHNNNSNSSNNEWKIGGLSINPDITNSNSSGEQWTRACKFLLTDMKWLVAYAVKHHVER